MQSLEIETKRLRSLRAMQAGLLDLKWLRDKLRFDRALSTHLFTLKYGYNPSQPRVSKREDGAGEWTKEGGSAGSSAGRVRLAGDIPTGGLPEIPRKRPPTSRQRTAILKQVARKIGEDGLSIIGLFEARRWLGEFGAEIQSYRDPPRTLEELQRRASSREAGYDIHHVVEQTQAEREGFSREIIDHPDNLVKVPRLKHQEINGWYQRKNDDFGKMSPREYLSGRSWAVRKAVGLDALRRFGVLKP